MVIGRNPSEAGDLLSYQEPARPSLRSEWQEVPMIKALLTPVILGLGVALLIRMAAARRA
jgi:hypothetical protein